MSEKRRDNKNRILQTGESQRKDGRYVYKYADNSGNPKFVYAWKLVPTDKTPAGKREDLSLREKEKEIQKDLDDGIDTISKKMTVCELYAKYIRQNGNVKANTKHGRNHLMKIIKSDKLGACSIGNVKKSAAKEWVLRMKEIGFAFNTIKNYKATLSAAFQFAVQDDCIRKNPFEFNVEKVIKDDTPKKEALTPEQEQSFITFVKNDDVYHKYYDEIIILLETGLRISELCGLTEADLNMNDRILTIDHQLLYVKEAGYFIADPKTKSGRRDIYINDIVYEAFTRVLQRNVKCNVEIDGYTSFLFCTRNGKPRVAVNYDTLFRNIKEKHNKCCEIELPRATTPHTMRHTFCTNISYQRSSSRTLFCLVLIFDDFY